MRVATDERIEALAREGAWFAFSVSGGKDSGAALHAGNAWLDQLRHPRDRRIALHADLGRAEWPETLDHVRRVADHVGIACDVVSNARDLVWRFEDRWRRSLDRYMRFETIALASPWSSSSSLFCRSEQKAVPLGRFKSKLPGGRPVVGVIGLRRDESARRAATPISAPDGDMLRRNRREGVLWNPILDWTTREVFEYHHEHAIPLHRAYSLGASRLSCAMCVLASQGDLAVAVASPGNLATFRDYVSLEIRSGFSFQSRRWLADVASDDRTDPVRLAEAKRIAAERRAIQADLPATLLKSRSVAGIDRTDAGALAGVRRRIGELYGVTPIGVTADEVMHIANGG